MTSRIDPMSQRCECVPLLSYLLELNMGYLMYRRYQQLRAPWGRHGSSGWTGTRPEVGRRVRVRTPPAHTPPDTGYADHRTAHTAQQPGPSEASIHKATSRATMSAHSTTTSYQPANSARGALHDCMGGKRNSTSSNAPAKPAPSSASSNAVSPSSRDGRSATLALEGTQSSQTEQRRRATDRWNALVRRPQSDDLQA